MQLLLTQGLLRGGVRFGERVFGLDHRVHCVGQLLFRGVDRGLVERRLVGDRLGLADRLLQRRCLLYTSDAADD